MNKHFLTVYGMVLCSTSILPAQQAAEGLRLCGIVNVPGMKCALLETPAQAWRRAGSLYLLEERQREGDLEILEIHPETGTVKLNLHRKNGLASLTVTNPISQGTSGISLANASLDLVLKLYGRLTGRSLLRHPTLPEVFINVATSAPDRSEAARILEQAFREKQIVTIPDGKRFIIVVPQPLASSISPHSTEIKTGEGDKTNEVLPPGAINFPGTDSIQVMQIYAELVGRKLDRSVSLPVPPHFVVRFQSQSPLNRQEAIYALDTLFAWSHVRMVPEGTDQIRAVPDLSSR